MQKLTPLLLRLGIAAALMSHGYRQVVPRGTAPTGQSLVGEQSVPAPAQADPLANLDPATASPPRSGAAPAVADPRLAVSPEGVTVQTGWTDVLGGAEILAGIALALGLLTRILSLGTLAAAGLAGFGQQLGVTDGTLGRLLESLPQAGAPTLILLATASLVLLMSGCGCLGVDGRLFSRRNGSGVDLTKP
ncbi:MAG: hypothetical protein C4547_03615 [Phycisphaerales bacterium]|nr:MAG: hypothetical protein C4547_03615 [Phycisphaerales bacterium]